MGDHLVNAFGDMILAARGAGAGIADAKTALSDRELVDIATALAADIARTAGRPRAVVAVALPLDADAVVHLLAAIIGDHTICFLDPSAAPDRRDAIVQALAPHVLVDADGMRALTGARPDDAATAAAGYIAMSSGSTGGALKGVLSTWEALAAFAPHGAEALELDAGALWAEVSHPAYDMAMTNLLVALSAGSGIRVAGGLGDRLRPLRLIDRVGATHVRLAPRFVELAAAEQRPAGTLRVWGSGGDRFQLAHVGQLFEMGVPVVVNTYGSSETTGFASAARLDAADGAPATGGPGGLAPIGHGTVGDWRTELVDHDGAHMLRIRSPHLPQGYLFGEAGEYPRWESPQSVLTGDVGVQIGEDLFCLGRAGRRVKRRGSFVDLDDIDATIRSSAGIASFTVLTPSGDLLSIVEGPGEDVAALQRDLPSVLRPEVLPDGLIPVRQIPRLGNGKIDHAAALALAESAG